MPTFARSLLCYMMPEAPAHSFSHEFQVPDSAIDALGHANNVEYVRWVQDVAGAHWLSICPAELRDQIIWVVRENNGKPFIAGTGGESTAQVIERSSVAAKIGADAVLVIAPFYNRGSMTPAILETHFKAVADACTVPVYVYNIPQVSGIAHSPAWMANIAQHPNIAGLKDSSGDIMTLTETARVVNADFNVLTGNAPTLLPALSVGAQGAILAAANVIPGIFGKLRTAFMERDLETALTLQRRSNALSYAVTRDFGVPGLKAAMRLRGVNGGYPRAPLLDVDVATMTKLELMLEEIKTLL